MPTSFLKRLRALPRDRKAATAVEFALLVTPLMALILASLQLSLIFFAGQILQTAAMAAGRELMTGSDQQAGMSQSAFQSNVCNYIQVLFTCNNVMVDVESASSYSSLNMTPLTLTYNAKGQVTNTWAYNPGGAGDIVILRVMYNWPVFGGPAALGLSDQPNGAHLLVATDVFKNEPWSSTSS